MRYIKTLGPIALLFVACAPSAFASFTPVSIESQTNADIRTYTGGSNYPVAPTSITVATVPFELDTKGGQANSLGVIQGLPQGSTFIINTVIVDPTTIYTLMNSAFGVSGENIGSIEFKGAGGADAIFQIVEGDNIRDHFNGVFNNSATNIVANAFLNGSQDPNGPDRLDMQTFVLPASFASDTLTEIIFSSSTNAGDPNGEPFLAAVTAQTGVPEPSSAMLLGIGIMGLACYVYSPRRRGSTANDSSVCAPEEGNSEPKAGIPVKTRYALRTGVL
jgi:hypothetical protein